MDYAIQKAVELGVNTITPLVTERTVVRLDEKRQDKKINHWQGIIISACEQCGRSSLPALNSVLPLDKWLTHNSQCKIVFDTQSQQMLSQLEPCNEVSILIGPEGGLADNELTMAHSKDFHSIRLGPRTLRTETAVVTACSTLQVLWGDLG
jgi:16S rRNA (uracil1498-N3)-methyltransferase